MYTPPATPPSTPLPPDLLLRKPGTVTAAQVMLWLQFSFLICCGAGTGLVGLFWTSVDFSDFAFDQDLTGGIEDLAALVTVVIVATIAVVVLYGILAVKIGAGRRWAQVVTILIMLASIVIGFFGLYAGFRTEDEAGAAVDGSRLIWTLLGLSMPLVTLLCLFTGSANQWFRQRGRDPLKGMPAPAPQYRPY
ncbi:hypothetical protein [Glycomyces albidus]|jgi:hypothetical protein|uniref:Uncharacterized protein n=1 Tax=Glycomyces albidus TaxID=2656774 RepID=A0A6L5G3T1_9ACTN|nr:hypothetical protein [Glycomyces albidus]MQM24375.1 hypothetical protein [Glycomyces albidus]